MVQVTEELVCKRGLVNLQRGFDTVLGVNVKSHGEKQILRDSGSTGKGSLVQ